MKKKIIIALCTLLSVAVIGTGIWGVMKVQADKAVVDVYSVSYVMGQPWGSEETLTGIISTDINQEIKLTDKQVVEEVYVQEGDQVEIGTELMKVDMTLVNIDLELERLSLENLGLRLELANSDLEKLKKEVPISLSEGKALAKDMILTANPSEEGETDETVIPEEVPQEELPQAESQALTTLDYNSIPYKGDGTTSNPYVFLVAEGTVIKGEFFNKMKGLDVTGVAEVGTPACFFIEIRENNLIEGGLIASWWKRGEALASCNPSAEWLVSNSSIDFSTDGSNDDLDGIDLDDGGGFWEDGGYVIPEGYTKSQLDKMKSEKEAEIRDLELKIKESNLKIEKIERQLEDEVIKSTVKGMVKKVGDPQVGADPDGSPFLVVTSEEGFYIKGQMSELQLESIKTGQIVQGSTWESGSVFQAEIKEISPYPTTGAPNYYGMGNTNVSYYPFIAYIENGNNLKNNENAELAAVDEMDEMSNSFYIATSYIRSEGNKSYVYIADENDRLKKTYITTGKNFQSYLTEVKQGLTMEDRIAFPYGKNVKDGTKVRDSEPDMFMGY
jgi:HlyD family secretion protein